MSESPPANPTDRSAATPIVDLLVAMGLVAVAAGVAVALPEGSPARLGLGLLGIVAPGYLFIQLCLAPARPGRERGVHVLLSLAVGPAFVGMVSLVAGMIPGMFLPNVIVVLVFTASLLCAAGAWYRRSPLALRRREVLRALRASKAPETAPVQAPVAAGEGPPAAPAPPTIAAGPDPQQAAPPPAQ